MRAGLGGPSADAAAVIMGLAYFWKLDATDPRLDAVARCIGADVAFFLHASPAFYVSGGGDAMLELYPAAAGNALALVKPMNGGASVSAIDAYAEFDEAPVAPADKPGAMLLACAVMARQHMRSSTTTWVAAPPACAGDGGHGSRVAPYAGQRPRRCCMWFGLVLFAPCNTQMPPALSALKDHGCRAQPAKTELSGPFIADG